MKRSAGVLMHISSLFGGFSVGSFGEEARYFVDFLSESGFSYWQVLPFCMPDEYNSPYKSYSSFGANPYFIDLPTLYEKGLLTSRELTEARQRTPYLAEYERLSEERLALLYKAAMRVTDRSEILSYVEKRRELCEAASFLALREKNENLPWQSFTTDKPDGESYFFWAFLQYEFYTQWSRIKEYANSKGIRIIGDLPIYVSLDSSDVYFNKEDFLLDAEGYPTVVAGVPPDYFSKDGQLWGNPLYDYDKMKKNSYSLWRRRVGFMLEIFDGVRIDHFRGIESFFAIPAHSKSAKEGSWVKGPGRELVDVIREAAGDKLIIAEDLGDITDEVRELVDYSGFSGMRVFQFAFLGDKDSTHLPHKYLKNSVAYTGTHDNNTLLGYVWEMTPENRRRVFDYCGYDGEDFCRGVRSILRTVLASVSDTAIIPIQDILGFGSDTRMNTPGVALGNWSYRITKEQLDGIDRRKISEILELYGR